jgi:hypothetical protein
MTEGIEVSGLVTIIVVEENELLKKTFRFFSKFFKTNSAEHNQRMVDACSRITFIFILDFSGNRNQPEGPEKQFVDLKLN